MPGAWTNEEFRQILTGEHEGFATFRNNLKRIPSSPRCKLCNAPFGGAGGAVMKHFGFGRFPGNPAICQNCISQYRKMGVTGAEIPVTLLFADIRGSTGIGERLSPTGFHDFLTYFYRLGSAAILDHGGIVDKLVGDEVIGLFFGGVSGPSMRRRRSRPRPSSWRGPGEPTRRRWARSRSAPGSTPGSPSSARPGPRARRRLHGARRSRQHLGPPGVRGRGRRAAGQRGRGRGGGHGRVRRGAPDARGARAGGDDRRRGPPPDGSDAAVRVRSGSSPRSPGARPVLGRRRCVVDASGPRPGCH